MKVNINVKQIDKALITNGQYLSVEVIPLKERQVKLRADKTPIEGVNENGAWRLVKTGFVKQSNPDKSVDMPIIGEATVFETVEAPKPVAPVADEISDSDIPF